MAAGHEEQGPHYQGESLCRRTALMQFKGARHNFVLHIISENLIKYRMCLHTDIGYL